MKKNTTPLVDEHLQSLAGMQEIGTDDFFYTRLRARMEKEEQPVWRFPLKPVWAIAALFALLLANGTMLLQDNKPKATTEADGIQGFAASYNLSVSSPY
jgi:steroid 5-alpha reductase family enzyme